MKENVKWAIVVTLFLGAVIFCLHISNVFFDLTIKNVSAEKVNKYFNTNIPDDSYIEKYLAKSDDETSYALKVKLNMRADEVGKVLSYYKKFEKDRHDDFIPFSEWGLSITNYDYNIIDFTSVTRKSILRSTRQYTQRSLYIFVTKLQDGKVSVYMSVDRIGGWKEEKGYK